MSMTNNEPIVYNKNLVEKISLGSHVLSIRNCSILWSEENRVNRLSESITNVIGIAKREIGIVGCSILRLVVVTGNFLNETTEWYMQLGEIWRVSSEGAVGQTLTWGDGQPGSTYSVIILSQDIAFGFVDGDSGHKSLAIGTLIHELAHVHDNVRYLHNFGPEPIPKQGDWMSHRQFMARSTWGEFYAESCAYPYLKNIYINENIAHSVTLLKGAIQDIRKETLAYKIHQNAGKVWGLAESKLSSVFNQFGRSLALLISDRRANENSNQVDHFFKEISCVSQEWEEIIHRLLDKLVESKLQVDATRFTHLGEIVDQGFRSIGLEPYKNLEESGC